MNLDEILQPAIDSFVAGCIKLIVENIALVVGVGITMLAGQVKRIIT